MDNDTNQDPAAGVGPVERRVGRPVPEHTNDGLAEIIKREAHETLRTFVRCGAVCFAVYIVTEALKAWAGVR